MCISQAQLKECDGSQKRALGQCVGTAQLQAMPNKLALIVNHENITQNWYVGNDRSMLVCNCLFRLGGAGALLSNRYSTVQSTSAFPANDSHETSATTCPCSFEFAVAKIK